MPLITTRQTTIFQTHIAFSGNSGRYSNKKKHLYDYMKVSNAPRKADEVLF